MLVLTRRNGETLVFEINGQPLGEITIKEVRTNQCKVAIEFPPNIRVLRKELIGHESKANRLSKSNPDSSQ